MILRLRLRGAGLPIPVGMVHSRVFCARCQDSPCLQLSFHPTHHAGQHYNSVRCAFAIPTWTRDTSMLLNA
eukprot:4068613-Amphidinium_carterae.1